MGKRFYKVVGGLTRMFSRKMKTEWEVPFEEGACIFVVNHAGAIGPFDMMTKFPLRDKCHPWINNGMLEKRKCLPMCGRITGGNPGAFSSPC